MWARAVRLFPTEAPADLRAWRSRQLVRAGFDSGTAVVLADTTVDLHALIELVESGCPPHLAERIMAPLDSEPAER
jgi:hypothetical protein